MLGIYITEAEDVEAAVIVVRLVEQLQTDLAGGQAHVGNAV